MVQVGESQLSMDEALCSRKDSFIRDDDADLAVCVARALKYFVAFPITILGIPANIVVIWVWSLELEYHPTSFLFRAQALTDTLTLVAWMVLLLVHGTFLRDIIVFSVARATRQMGVQITMFLAVIRVIKLILPHSSTHLLSPFRIKVVLAGIAVWNITTMHLVSYFLVTGSQYYYTTNQLFGNIINTVIPAGLQLILMVTVTWRVWRTYSRFKADQGEAVRSQQDNKGQKSVRRVVYTVFAMCVLTFIAYFVGWCAFLFFEQQMYGAQLGEPYRLVVYSIFTTIGDINSSVNIVFYYFFISRFQVLLSKRLGKIRQKWLSLHVSFSVSWSSSHMIPNTAHNPDGDTDMTRSEVSEDVTGCKLLESSSYDNTASDEESPEAKSQDSRPHPAGATLLAPVDDTHPPTTAAMDYAIGLRKLSANGELLAGTQIEVSL